MSGVSFKVEGLRAVASNLREMSKRIQANIARTSLRAAARVLVRAAKSKTYSTFDRETGLVQRGLTAGVARTNTQSTKQFASVFERQQKIPTRTAAGRLASARLGKRNKSGTAPMKAKAFWWRYLEFGTGSRKGKGAIRARPWIGPASTASASEAVEAFRDSMKQRIAEEAATLPSTRGKT